MGNFTLQSRKAPLSPGEIVVMHAFETAQRWFGNLGQPRLLDYYVAFKHTMLVADGYCHRTTHDALARAPYTKRFRDFRFKTDSNYRIVLRLQVLASYQIRTACCSGNRFWRLPCRSYRRGPLAMGNHCSAAFVPRVCRSVLSRCSSDL